MSRALLLAVQDAWSALPTPGRRVAETLHTREGWHLYLYPLAGRLARMVQALKKAADVTTSTQLADHPMSPAEMAWDVPNGAGARRGDDAEDTPRRPRRRHGF